MKSHELEHCTDWLCASITGEQVSPGMSVPCPWLCRACPSECVLQGQLFVESVDWLLRSLVYYVGFSYESVTTRPPPQEQ